MTEIKIFDDENSILLSNEDYDIKLDFFPDFKEFKSTLSIKNDCYYRNELYEYKLSADPIEVLIRLRERSDEPPEHYLIKDGVVLESEMDKNNKILGKNFINGLKNSVEWHKIDLSNYVEFFYILSIHSEIISNGEYKKFLRQTEQRIKLGLSKVAEMLKQKDNTGLQIIDGKFGKQIWYPDNSESKDIPDKERNEKFDYVENNFYKHLFDKKSSEYCGISKEEFSRSLEILQHIDKLLNKKEVLISSNNNGEKKKNNWRWLGYIWTIIVDLITLGVVVAIYNKISNDYNNFEIIVISILILIYLSIQSYLMVYSQTMVKATLGLDVEFKRIRKLLKNEPDESEIKEFQEAQKKVDKAMIKIYINAAFLFIVYLIVLFSLFGSL